jgi:hypothetical protein
MRGHQVGEHPLGARNVVAKPIDLELEVCRAGTRPGLTTGSAPRSTGRLVRPSRRRFEGSSGSRGDPPNLPAARHLACAQGLEADPFMGREEEALRATL